MPDSHDTSADVVGVTATFDSRVLVSAPRAALDWAASRLRRLSPQRGWVSDNNFAHDSRLDRQRLTVVWRRGVVPVYPTYAAPRVGDAPQPTDVVSAEPAPDVSCDDLERMEYAVEIIIGGLHRADAEYRRLRRQGTSSAQAEVEVFALLRACDERLDLVCPPAQRRQGRTWAAAMTSEYDAAVNYVGRAREPGWTRRREEVVPDDATVRDSIAETLRRIDAAMAPTNDDTGWEHRDAMVVEFTDNEEDT